MDTNPVPLPRPSHSTAALLTLGFFGFLGCQQEYELVQPVDVNPGDVTECGFTRVDDTAFYAYDCNPVFTATGEDWAPDVGSMAFNVTYVMGHPFYQLWYVAYDDDDNYAMGYAVSNNGTDWEPYPDNPLISNEGAKGFERDVMQANEVLWDPDRGEYVMIYSGLNLSGSSDGGTGVLTSPDGIDWTRIDANPVLLANDTGVPGVSGFCWPLDINLVGGQGYTGYIAGTRSASGPCEAFRLDGSGPGDWTVDKDVAFPAGGDGDWDDEGLISLNEADLDGDNYLFYVGFGKWTSNGSVRTATNSYLGWAREKDGDWDKEPDPIPINTTEEGEVSAVGAVTVGDRVHLWVTDNYDGETGVGLFLYDPVAAAAEDGE